MTYISTSNTSKKNGSIQKKICISLFTFLVCACQKTQTINSNIQPKKNVIFILADDLGARDLSVEGSTYYESPNIDNIANKGVRFTKGYSASRVCSPSRASIMTGNFVTNHGITAWIGDKHGKDWHTKSNDKVRPANYTHHLKQDTVSLAERFQDAGYRTFFAGKWHLGGEGSSPEDHGFEINKGGISRGGPPGGFFSPFNNPKLTDTIPGESLTLRLGRETAHFIEQQDDQPFFAFLSFYAVHAPIQTTRTLWEKYQKKSMLHSAVEKRFKFDRRLAVRQVQDCPIYAGMIESMDAAVGMVIDKLQEKNLSDNTIIFFTSDNGGVSSGDNYATSNRPLRGGKGRHWEGGIRVPYYIYDPSKKPSKRVIEVPVSGVDAYPTLLDLANINIDTIDTDGVSLRPLIEDREIQDRALYWHFPHYGNQGGEPSSLILEDDWKLIFHHEDERYELYNLLDDPSEQQNVAPKAPKKTEMLSKKLHQWLSETQAIFPRPNPDFDPDKKAKRLRHLKTSGMTALEQKHAEYLDVNFDPGNHWWGSEPPQEERK